MKKYEGNMKEIQRKYKGIAKEVQREYKGNRNLANVGAPLKFAPPLPGLPYWVLAMCAQ